MSILAFFALRLWLCYCGLHIC